MFEKPKRFSVFVFEFTCLMWHIGVLGPPIVSLSMWLGHLVIIIDA